MRVALGIHYNDIPHAIESYKLMSQKFFTHATPTLFAAGTKNPQLSSCFLLTTKGDSIEGMYSTVKDCAIISKYAGGIGLSVTNVRSSGSSIKGTNGTSDGIVPWLRVLNNTAKHVNQAGRRPGAISVYLEPWHGDILEFLDLRLNHGAEEHRARDLFYAMWLNDLFMRRVEKNESWTLFSPNEVPELTELYGDLFEDMYLKYENDTDSSRWRKTVRAQDIWMKILKSQQETGVPYLLSKDAINKKSNQKNLGTIHCSNLCAEIAQYSDNNETAVCNLASIALPAFVTKKGKFDYAKLQEVTRVVTRNINNIIDNNFYPISEAERSNKRHRPMGIGTQGLADVFQKMELPFDSDEAKQINRLIYENMYYAALSESCELAKIHGAYETYQGSPVSKGLLQFDFWENPILSLNWDKLKEQIIQYGIRNSLLMAAMPTASTSRLFGNNECFEPYATNMLTRRTKDGEFIIINKNLMQTLDSLGLRNDTIINEIKRMKGSIQSIDAIPQNVKDIYKTVWEIKQKALIDLSVERGWFTCQTQSMNMFVRDATIAKLSSMYFYSWKRGLKTLVYYLRTEAASDPKAITVQTCENCSA